MPRAPNLDIDMNPSYLMKHDSKRTSKGPVRQHMVQVVETESDSSQDDKQTLPPALHKKPTPFKSLTALVAQAGTGAASAKVPVNQFNAELAPVEVPMPVLVNSRVLLDTQTVIITVQRKQFKVKAAISREGFPFFHRGDCGEALTGNRGTFTANIKRNLSNPDLEATKYLQDATAEVTIIFSV